MTKPKLGMKTTGERIVTVDTWSGLQEALFEGSWNQRIRRHRSPHLFRGHGRADFELTSSLVRHGELHSKLEPKAPCASLLD